jgi:hypothetical protein
LPLLLSDKTGIGKWELGTDIYASSSKIVTNTPLDPIDQIDETDETDRKAFGLPHYQ